MLVTAYSLFMLFPCTVDAVAQAHSEKAICKSKQGLQIGEPLACEGHDPKHRGRKACSIFLNETWQH